ncbi:MAG: DNA replication/repair protein RecF [Blautia sp.]|nr:DNA replication/repair protein RecF [Blautia sp.]
MYVESVELDHFRNYADLKIGLHTGTNLFFGDNAQGKTNILEAVYLCGTTKSHRTLQDRDMIQFGEEQAHIRIIVQKAHISYKIDMHLRRDKSKAIAISGIPIRKARELLGLVNFVFFSPEDLNIIKNGPAQRRRFLDAELCQLDSIYLSDLTDYNKIVSQRNKLLKDLSFNPSLLSTLDVWDEQLVKYGKKIIEKRADFMQELSETARQIHSELTGGTEDFHIVYEPDCAADELADKLSAARERDCRHKTTSAGPHRDDFCVSADNIDLRKFGSQGQQRTAALSLKLSEIKILEKKIKDTPILLLDDVLSELDSRRQEYLLDSIHDIQTLITCTGLEDFAGHRFRLDRIYHVSRGTVTISQ